jgi:hypothetical protein
LKLGLSGYYQPAFALLRDVMEVGFLIHYFFYWPEKVSEWKNASDEVLKKNFAPVHIRTALDDKEGSRERKRQRAYEILCQYGAHATYKGFRMTMRENMGQIGPFVEATPLRAFVEECVLRIGPSAVLFGTLFPKAPAPLIDFKQRFEIDLIAAVKREEVANSEGNS